MTEAVFDMSFPTMAIRDARGRAVGFLDLDGWGARAVGI